MTTKPYKCRTHDGMFRIEVRRGRPPVNCSEGNRCDAFKPKRSRVVTKENTATAAEKRRSNLPSETETKRKLARATGLREEQIIISKPSRVERVASAIKNRKTSISAEVPFRERPTEARAKAPEMNAESVSTANRSVQVAQAARAELEAVGWTAKGRGWTDGDDAYAELTANRGSETIVITWCNGSLTGQDYSIWHSKPSRNAMPKRRLKFNPDEMTDGELIRAISGMKVTWWNSLAKSEESFTVGTKTLAIEHSFAANGDEDSAKRIVKFVDMNGGGFRHFHVDALLKVG